MCTSTASGIIHGYSDHTFHPFNSATRTEALTVIYQALWTEKGNLPDDSNLTSVADGDENDVDQAFQENRYDRFQDISKLYSTGLDAQVLNYAYQVMQDAQARGFTMSNTRTGTLDAEIIKKCDRYDVHLTNEDSSASYYYLKRMPDQSWKIYYSTNTAPN